MKKALFVSAFISIAWIGELKAIEPVSVIPWLPESTYTISQSTISVSSTSVTTIAAVSGYRSVHLSNLLNTSTTLYYRIDGSTVSIGTVGYPIAPGDKDHAIETNGVISLQLAVGSSVGVFTKTIRK